MTSIKKLEELLQDGETYSRKDLANALGMSDRGMRRLIEAARNQGVPIVSPEGGGYKLAATEEERWNIMRDLRNRACKLISTSYKLQKQLQDEGQIKI